MAVLQMPKIGIDITAFEQFLMRAAGVYGAAFEHEDLVALTSEERRCEITISVRPCAIFIRLALTMASLSASSALVASSSIRMRGSPIRARAIASRCAVRRTGWSTPPG